MNIIISQLDNLILNGTSFRLIPEKAKAQVDIDGMLVGANGRFMVNSKDAMFLIENSDLRKQLGETAYRSLLKKPLIIFTMPTSDEEFVTNPSSLEMQYGTIALHLSNFAQMFSIGCWLIKDSCITAKHTYWTNLFNHYYCNYHRDISCTMSDGTVSQISLTDSEVLEALQMTHEVDDYLSPNESKMGKIIVTHSGNTLFWNIDRAISNIKKEGNSFSKALVFLQEARNTGILPSKIEKYCSTLECLFAIDDKGIKKWLSTITASYLGTDNISREEIRLNMVHAYSIRSESIHGDNIKYLQKHPEIKMEELSTILDNYVRNVFKKIFTEKSLNYSASSQDKTRVKKHFQELATTFYPKEPQQNSI